MFTEHMAWQAACNLCFTDVSDIVRYQHVLRPLYHLSAGSRIAGLQASKRLH